MPGSKGAYQNLPPIVWLVLSALPVGLHKEHWNLPILQLSFSVSFCLHWIEVWLFQNGLCDITPFWQRRSVWALRKKVICCGRPGCGKHFFFSWGIPWWRGLSPKSQGQNEVWIRLSPDKREAWIWRSSLSGRWLLDSVKKKEVTSTFLSVKATVPPYALVPQVCQESWSGAKWRPQ